MSTIQEAEAPVDVMTSINWTPEQILALAPDPTSAKAGRKESSPKHWTALGFDGRIAWGKCQGSGVLPYEAQIDTAETVFKCTCPSRKFPCKHGLGLFLLLIEQPALFSQSTQPTWVEDWIKARAIRDQKRAAKEARGGEVVDPEAQTKRAAQRQEKIAAGMEELKLWIGDLVRNGLATVQTQPQSYWDSI